MEMTIQKTIRRTKRPPMDGRPSILTVGGPYASLFYNLLSAPTFRFKVRRIILDTDEQGDAAFSALNKGWVGATIFHHSPNRDRPLNIMFTHHHPPSSVAEEITVSLTR